MRSWNLIESVSEDFPSYSSVLSIIFFIMLGDVTSYDLQKT